jgi:hypothetical protein
MSVSDSWDCLAPSSAARGAAALAVSVTLFVLAEMTSSVRASSSRASGRPVQRKTYGLLNTIHCQLLTGKDINAKKNLKRMPLNTHMPP